MNKRTVIASAFAAALVAPTIVIAERSSSEPAFKTEKCYGIARAGQNDCASAGSNSCAGTSKADADSKAWMLVPVGYCDRIVGGSKASK